MSAEIVTPKQFNLKVENTGIFLIFTPSNHPLSGTAYSLQGHSGAGSDLIGWAAWGTPWTRRQLITRLIFTRRIKKH